MKRRPVVLLVQPARDDGLEMYAEFLRYHGFAVIPVSNARNALMQAPQADIVVTGIILDEPMDGVELVSRLRHDDGTRSTPIVVLTACAWPEDWARAVGAGCDVFLPKPCLPNDLLGEVQKFLTATNSQTADTPHVFQHPPRTTAIRGVCAPFSSRRRRLSPSPITSAQSRDSSIGSSSSRATAVSRPI